MWCAATEVYSTLTIARVIAQPQNRALMAPMTSSADVHALRAFPVLVDKSREETARATAALWNARIPKPRQRIAHASATTHNAQS